MVKSLWSVDSCDSKDLHILLFEQLWVVAVKAVRWCRVAFPLDTPEHTRSLAYLPHLLGYDVVKMLCMPRLVMLHKLGKILLRLHLTNVSLHVYLWSATVAKLHHHMFILLFGHLVTIVLGW